MDAQAQASLVIYRSRDAGELWEPMSEGLEVSGACDVSSNALALDDLDEEGIYAGTSRGEIFSSRDEGETWDCAARGLPAVTAIEPLVILGD